MTTALLTARESIAARRGDPRFVVGIAAAAAGAAHLLALAGPHAAAVMMRLDALFN